jgi:endogenous inhibitor of DNA gyrase (YacG/DUF329 family)
MMQFQCPVCKSKVASSTQANPSPFFPFCSQRCRLVDLGQWLDGNYRIPVTPDPLDEDDQSPADEQNG